MGFWETSLHIFKCFCDHGTQSVRRLAQKTGLSKSSVHRLQQAMARRGGHPESWLWETEEGRQWLTRLVVATLYTFGLKRGVGMDTMHEFFARLRLATQVGCSPSALRRVMQTLEATILETVTTWEKDGVARGAGQEIIGAVDETFLERMVLILLDLTTGYVVLEETADDRSYATWKALVDQRLDALGAQVRYVVSDRAKALIQLAEKGLECLSMPDFFHLVHDIVKSYSLALGQRLKQARQELQKAEDRLRRRQEGDTQARLPGGHASGGGAPCGGDALGSETTGVSAAARNPLPHAPSFCDRRFRTPDLHPGGSPVARAGRGHRSLSPRRAVAGAASRHDEGQKTVARCGGPGRFLVARRAPGFGARRCVSSLAAVGARSLTAAAVLGASSHPHALRPEENQDAAGIGEGPRRV